MDEVDEQEPGVMEAALELARQRRIARKNRIAYAAGAGTTLIVWLVGEGLALWADLPARGLMRWAGFRSADTPVAAILALGASVGAIVYWRLASHEDPLDER